MSGWTCGTAGPVSVLIDGCGLALGNLLTSGLTSTLGSMSPLSLLFSSDEETSRVLIQALRELEFEVEHCPEIFAAVQRLTSRKMDVIVADWDEGLEASFLLKTSRELKSNSAAVTAALVSGREAEIAARHLGVECVLKKPFNVEQAKYALLTSDVFLGRMREWLPKILAQQQSGPRNPSPVSSARAPRASRANSSDHIQRSGRNVGEGPGSVLWKYSEKSKRARHNRANAFLIAAIATTCLSCAYVVHDSRRLSALVSTVSPSLRKAWSGMTAGERTTRSDSSPADAVAMEREELPAREGVTRIRVVTAHHSSIENTQSRNADDKVAVAELSPELVPAVPVPKIPESLRSEVPARGSGGPGGNALLEALEPVNITEDLSENLLLEKVLPKYPEQAVRSGLQGSVVLEALIGRDGRIQRLKLMQGSFLLGQSAFEAVKQWRYRPYFLNGRAVQAQTLVTVDFSLPRRAASLPTSR